MIEYIPAIIASQLTSIADADVEYKVFCQFAQHNEDAFAHFRRHPAMVRIHQHVSYQEGEKYLEIIKSEYGELVAYFPLFHENETIGDPVIASFGENLFFSPTTLRYIKTVGELRHLFGPLSSMKILEIGPGYGGLCNLIAKVDSFSEFALVDLPECIGLAQKFLDRAKVANVRSIYPSDLVEEKWDLVISNYAFSECDWRVQDFYFEKILKNAKRGYLTCNYHGKNFGVSSYAKHAFFMKLKAVHPSACILDENPLTAQGNCLIIWGSE